MRSDMYHIFRNLCRVAGITVAFSILPLYPHTRHRLSAKYDTRPTAFYLRFLIATSLVQVLRQSWLFKVDHNQLRIFSTLRFISLRPIFRYIHFFRGDNLCWCFLKNSSGEWNRPKSWLMPSF